ncbi:type II toxin-antitoxin system TacA family antitoxin [Bradyrhizobium sp. USDA 4353]
MSKTPSRAGKGRVRAERLETRVTAAQKSLIERAAALQGRSVTDFVLASVQDAARRTIEEHNQLALSVRDSEAFVDALLKPQPVNDRLRDTVRRYRERTGV